MADTVTLQSVDALLRARSDANLTVRIDDLLAPVLAIVADATDPQAATDAVVAFKVALFGFLQVPRQQQGIAAFLAAAPVTELVETS